MSSVSYIAFKDKDGILRRFEGEIDNHTRMKIRLLYDGLTQSEFFRAYVEAYIDGDPHILEFVERIKKRKGKRNMKKLAKTRRLHEMAREIKNQFGLSDEDIRAIFDLPIEEQSEL
tara:strand:+ start:240 stop:587 length:348 start_codon:yes stop_codon:yes gene_type:complete